jgi:hypothetical protein
VEQARPTNDRFGPEHLDAWRRDGGLVIEHFFTPEEVAAVRADFELVFGRSQGAAEALVKKREGEVGWFNAPPSSPRSRRRSTARPR